MAALRLLENTRHYVVVAPCPRTQIRRHLYSIFLISTLVDAEDNARIVMDKDGAVVFKASSRC